MYRVYLVDDDTLILEELVNFVPWLDNGFEVAGYSTDPSVAIDEIIKQKPDVVFCDLKMPGMDGNEMIRTLKDKGTEAEYVMISAYDSFSNVREFFQQSGFDYILKPVKNEDIRMVLEELNVRLSKKNPRKEENIGTSIEFDTLVAYVRENFTGNITLDLLSKEFGFAKNYICGLFQKTYNKSLNRFLTELRMDYARNLLIKEKKMIKEVALMCGYTDYHHFFKVFKKYYGISPKEMQEEG